MLPNKPHAVNRPCGKFARLASPTIDEIPVAWREYSAMESLAPVPIRGGLARARTALLAGVPSWRLPEVLESLTTRGIT